jgi:hypothetical protein
MNLLNEKFYAIRVLNCYPQAQAQPISQHEGKELLKMLI